MILLLSICDLYGDVRVYIRIVNIRTVDYKLLLAMMTMMT